MLEADQPLFPLPPGRDGWEQLVNRQLRGLVDAGTRVGGLMVTDGWWGPQGVVGVLGAGPGRAWLVRTDLGAFHWDYPLAPADVRVEWRLEALDPRLADVALRVWAAGLPPAGQDRFRSRGIGGITYRFTVWGPEDGVRAGGVWSGSVHPADALVRIGLTLRDLVADSEAVRTTARRAAAALIEELSGGPIRGS
jgi:hypothetical protein